MTLGKIRSWGRRSLPNLILLFEVTVGVPCFLVFCIANYFEGTLTFDWGLRILVVAMSMGIVVAVPTWFIFVAPSARREPARKRQR